MLAESFLRAAGAETSGSAFPWDSVAWLLVYHLSCQPPTQMGSEVEITVSWGVGTGPVEGRGIAG